MALKFVPEQSIADSTKLTTISAVIEKTNAEQKAQTLTTSLVGSRLLNRLEQTVNATQNADTVSDDDVNIPVTLSLLEALEYKKCLEASLKLVNNMTSAIQYANERQWYRDFLQKNPHRLPKEG